ncbi:hypothetical protein [Bacillus sp. PS06]|uniref:hypothetical protein n=1 Tax=Bacillus sp. PS06 TaxID=2764176 RepID=UPI0017824A25|nr:hypothetical protein [Bacillus sp. PS06]MBD8068499.1 hypothetical protein [Bacillus sp. PS06]
MRREGLHEHNPNNDGKYEGVINDSMATESNQMGVRSDVNPENNPLHLQPSEDEEMKKFSKFFDGKKK